MSKYEQDLILKKLVRDLLKKKVEWAWVAHEWVCEAHE